MDTTFETVAWVEDDEIDVKKQLLRDIATKLKKFSLVDNARGQSEEVVLARIERFIKLLTELNVKVLESVDFLIDFDKVKNKDGEFEQHKRDSGELYVYHPLAVLQTMIEEFHFDKLDDNNIDIFVATVLHDVYEDEMEKKGYKFWGKSSVLRVVREKFGDRVGEMIYGVSKYKEAGKVNDAATYENTLSLALAHPAILKIRLADRLHNWRTIGSMSLIKKIESVKETQEFFRPVAARLGLFKVVAEFDDCINRVMDEVKKYNELHVASPVQMLVPADYGIDFWLNQLKGEHYVASSVWKAKLKR